MIELDYTRRKDHWKLELTDYSTKRLEERENLSKKLFKGQLRMPQEQMDGERIHSKGIRALQESLD